jgi:hypothetical protein
MLIAVGLPLVCGWSAVMVFEPCEPKHARRAHPGAMAGDEAQLLDLRYGGGRVPLADAEAMKLMIGRLQPPVALPGMPQMLEQQKVDQPHRVDAS